TGTADGARGRGAFHRRRSRGPRVDNVDIEDIRMVLSGELESYHPEWEHGPQRGDRDCGVFPVGRHAVRRAPRLAFVPRAGSRGTQGRVGKHLRRLTQPEIAQRAGGGANRTFTSSAVVLDRKSTRLNSSHRTISYA